MARVKVITQGVTSSNKRNEDSEGNVLEITWQQLLDTLRVINQKYGDFTVMLNMDKTYKPERMSRKAKFVVDCDLLEGSQDDLLSLDRAQSRAQKLVYLTGLDGEIVPKTSVSSEMWSVLNTVCDVNHSFDGDDIALMMDYMGRTFSISGIYIDENKKTITLLNGYYGGEPVNWNKELHGLHDGTLYNKKLRLNVDDVKEIIAKEYGIGTDKVFVQYNHYNNNALDVIIEM